MSRKSFNTAVSNAGTSGSALVDAIDAGESYQKIYELVRGGADPNGPDKSGRTPMKAAMDAECFRVADLLLQAGAEPPRCSGAPDGPIAYDGNDPTTLRDIERETALTYCLKHGNWYQYMYAFIANGANVNLPNQDGETPLYLALARPWSFVATQLVKYGAWINPRKPDPDEAVDMITGATRLLAVIMEGEDAHAVKRVLDEGASPDKPDRYGLTPLALARALKWTYVENMLLEAGANPETSFPDPNQKVGWNGTNNDTPLICYAANGQTCHGNYQAALLEAGADPDATGPDGKAAAHWAAVYGNSWLFQVLREKGANILMPDAKYGLTPLHYACMNNNDDVVAEVLDVCPPELISQGVGDNARTPLHMAAGRKGSAPLLQRLIDAGADVNARDKNGCTPLHEAVNTRDIEAVRVLLKNGADLDKANEGKRYNPPLFTLVNSLHDDNVAIGKLLLEAGASPHVRATESINGPQKGDSLLYFAVTYRAYDLARELLKAGADPHDTSHRGESAMHHCLHLRQTEGVKLLLEFGFDPLRQFDFTQQWSGGGGTRNVRYTGSCYDEAKALVAMFGHDREYGEMLDIIEEHLVSAAPASPKLTAVSSPRR